jgi:cytochrome c
MPEESKLASFDEYSGYQIINLPNNIAYDAKKSKESKEIKISKSEKMRNKLKYLAWLKKN